MRDVESTPAADLPGLPCEIAASAEVTPPPPALPTPPKPVKTGKTDKGSSMASEIKDMEDRWDLRFSRMETAIGSDDVRLGVDP